ncbi:MAG: dihydroneopterin aldolase [Anaerolineae bacterium]|nr:dihydroneopterin aldolase [Anaerolineae bacterium]
MENDKIIISDLLVRGLIGFQPWELEKRQNILINLVLYTDVRKPGESDEVADALNYKTITKTIIGYIEEGDRHYNLVESLATEIARICIEGGAERAVVRVEKPGALRFARSVGVEIERSRADFDREK